MTVLLSLEFLRCRPVYLHVFCCGAFILAHFNLSLVLLVESLLMDAFRLRYAYVSECNENNTVQLHETALCLRCSLGLQYVYSVNNVRLSSLGLGRKR